MFGLDKQNYKINANMKMVDEKMIKHQGRKAEKNYFCIDYGL